MPELLNPNFMDHAGNATPNELNPLQVHLLQHRSWFGRVTIIV